MSIIQEVKSSDWVIGSSLLGEIGQGYPRKGFDGMIVNNNTLTLVI